jgi:hypothetical protein
MGKRIIAVAVGILVAVALGVGGVLVASRSSQGTPATLPALDVSSSADQAGTSAQAPAERSGPVDGNAESRIPPSGRVQYQVRGTLPDLPRSARAWTLPDQVTKARVAELAGKLGMSGQPTRSGQAWVLTDGARRLFVNQMGGGPWTFSAGRLVCGAPVGGFGPMGGIAPRIVGCPVPGQIPPLQQPPSAPASGAQPGSAPSAGSSGEAGAASSVSATAAPRQAAPPAPQPPRPVPLPDRASAERIARDLFGRVGAPMNGSETQLVQSFDRWSVSTFPRVGGQPTTGFIWTAGIGPKGEILSATGWLDSPRQSDDYPLISVQEALQRLRNRQTAGPITESGSLPCARLTPSRPPAGGCGPARPLTLQVTNVRLGLQFAISLAQQGGARQSIGYLIPAYFFQIDGSWDRQVSVIAVQDRFLTTTPPPTEVPLRPGG